MLSDVRVSEVVHLTHINWQLILSTSQPLPHQHTLLVISSHSRNIEIIEGVVVCGESGVQSTIYTITIYKLNNSLSLMNAAASSAVQFVLR